MQGPKSKPFPTKPGGIIGPKPNIDRAQPLYMQADQLLYDTRNNRVIAQGNVEIYYNNYILTADQVVYDQGVNKLIAEGNAQLKDPNGGITRADRFEALDDFRDAFIQSLSVVAADDTRIAAERASRREGNTTEYERGKFTPCKSDPGMPPLWCIGAARIIHDQRAATISYQDAQFEFFGVPILYTPYFQHPDPTVKHRSGFLMPTMGNSSTLGFFTEVPYYFALSPNYDFTLHPRYYSKYGMLWQGEWRHRLANGQYNIKVWGIDQEKESASSIIEEGWRGSIQTRGQFSLSSWWRFGWDVTADSDEAFRRFYKLDPIVQTDRVNTVYLQGMSDRNYFAAKLYQFGGLLITDTPYSNAWVHPVIDYNYIVGGSVLGGELSFNAHARSLTRSDSTDSSRVVLEADWRRKIDRSRGPGVDALRACARRRLQLQRRRRSHHPEADPGRHGGAWRRRGRRPLLLPLRRAHGVRVARDRTDGPDHHAPEPGQSAPPARRGRQEPDLRRYAAVRYRQVLRLRPLRDGDEGQRRAAVHAADHVRHLRARGVRPELPGGGREPLRQSGPGPDRSLQLLAGQRPRDQPLGLRRRPLSLAVHGRHDHHPVEVRREGLEPAPQRLDDHRQLRPIVGIAGVLRSRISTRSSESSRTSRRSSPRWRCG